MTFEDVRKILADDPDIVKEIRLDDGRTFRVAGVEQWAAGPYHVVVIEPGTGTTYFPLRKIASITLCPPDGRQARRRRVRR